MQGIDTVIMGRATCDQLESLSKQFPYPDQRCYVFTRSLAPEDPNVEFVREDVSSFVAKLKRQQGKSIWPVGGAGLADDFLQAGLIDEFIVSTVPVLLGKGIPLFHSPVPELSLEFKDVRRHGQIAQFHHAVRF
ncbi:dihydrofolate reductase family protein [Paenibacillus doosanensis]|nr:dihydrofolate reductase family protein [Paenibacillus doosanensis]